MAYRLVGNVMVGFGADDGDIIRLPSGESFSDCVHAETCNAVDPVSGCWGCPAYIAQEEAGLAACMAEIDDVIQKWAEEE